MMVNICKSLDHYQEKVFIHFMFGFIPWVKSFLSFEGRPPLERWNVTETESHKNKDICADSDDSGLPTSLLSLTPTDDCNDFLFLLTFFVTYNYVVTFGK